MVPRPPVSQSPWKPVKTGDSPGMELETLHLTSLPGDSNAHKRTEIAGLREHLMLVFNGKMLRRFFQLFPSIPSINMYPHLL